MTRFRPTDENQLAETIAAAMNRDEPMEVIAGGSKRALGRKVAATHVLDLSAFSGIGLYEPEELVLTAGPATPLAEIEAALGAHRQHLAFEPPDWRHLWNSAAAPTLGGALACNLAGPRRIKDGAARDHHLGFRAVSGRGEPFKSGGRVVKNVTGYDLSKLMAGSYGTLAALTEVTVKVLPAPEETRSILLRGLTDAAAGRAMAAAMASPHEVSGAAHLPRGTGGGDNAVTLLRLEGHAPSVVARSEALSALLREFADCEIADRETSLPLWRSIGDATPFARMPDRAIWRISVPPSAGAALVARLAPLLDFAHFYDWAGGLVWLGVAGAEDGGAAAIRAAMPQGDGHATLIRGSDALRETVAVFQPLAPALGALAQRVKESFDPKRILNPGRMYREI